jgi:hypothetical protein
MNTAVGNLRKIVGRVRQGREGERHGLESKPGACKKKKKGRGRGMRKKILE